MGFDYSRLQNTATRLIDRFSEQDITINREVGASMVDGAVVAGSTVQFSVSAVVTPYLASQVNNTSIFAGDLQVNIKHDVEPLLNDEFVIDGKSYKRVGIKLFKPSATTLCYRVHVRQ
jgi:hypothetical protein